MDPQETELEKKLQERFAQLPAVVQQAITSADVQKHLRDLADTHKLHVDQWAVLENEVKMALYGFDDVANLKDNIKNEVGVDAEVASMLAADISKNVFEPIRGELERLLDHPAATAATTTDVEDARTQELAQESATAAGDVKAPAAAAVAPATPPPVAPTEKAVRGTTPQSYVAAPSHERKTIEGDPYREQLS